VPEKGLNATLFYTMEISTNYTDNLNAVVTVNVKPEDYRTQVDKALKDYRKQVTMPGFRAGHVPMSVVQKRYGKAILAEELNKILNDAIYKHIQENKINILGNPLPTEGAGAGDWDNPNEFQFHYELGLAPAIDLAAVLKQQVNRHVIKIDDEVINRQINDLARRYGKMSEPEVSEDKDMLIGTFTELDAAGNEKEGGISKDGTISIEFIKDEATRQSLIGKKKDEVVVVDPFKVEPNHDELGKLLGISHAEVHHLDGNFNFKINRIGRMDAAEINQELFDKVYGPGNIADEAAFRAKVTDDLTRMFGRETDRLFRRDLVEGILDNVHIDMPDAFLKRWIAAANENPLTEEQIEKEYPSYARGMRWQLIETKIAEENNIKISQDELFAFTGNSIRQQYAQYGLELDDEQLEPMVRNALSKREDINRTYEMMMEDKVVAYLRDHVAITEKHMSYEDFVKHVQSVNKGHHHHDHEHEHAH
jgi:trigger factor